MIAAGNRPVLGIAAVAVLAGLAGPAPAESELVELCTRVRPAFVFIRGGSGVVIRSGVRISLKFWARMLRH